MPVVLPVVLYFVLRPENYSITPNSLDPVFYTGYSMNFDDMMNAVGDRHYFVTRWTVYYPMYLFDAISGPIVGRLLWRWVLAAAICFAIGRLGGRLGWNATQRVLACVLVLTMPFFVRAFFTDYFEYVSVALGIGLTVVCARERQSVWTGGLIGVLVGLALVANPIAVFASALCCLMAFVLCDRGIRGRLVLVGSATAGLSTVILAGLVLFRWRYGIDDVYRPTIEFMRTYPGNPSAWKSPRLDWMGRFVWLYAPPILLVAAFALGRRRRVTWQRLEVAVLALSGAQYGVQWFDQFVRDGFGLEISYYWSYMIPSFSLAVAVVAAKFTADARQWTVSLLVLGWVAVMFLGIHPSVRLPAGLAFVALAAAVVAFAVVLAGRWPAAAVGLIAVLLGWTQIGAPSYDPSAYFYLNTSPKYDELFRRGGDESEQVLREAVWFAEQMDLITNDASTSFATAGGWSSSIVGLYAPHVTGRLVPLGIGADGVAARLTDDAVREIKAGGRPILAIYGDPAQVERIAADVDASTGLGEVVLDETHGSALGYRLVVYLMPDATRLPFTWTADALYRATGSLSSTAVVVTPSVDVPGFITFGPHTSLPVGVYTATVMYASPADAATVVGGFDVARGMQSDVVGQSDLLGTSDNNMTVTIDFEVSRDGDVWQFRTNWIGASAVSIKSIKVSQR